MWIQNEALYKMHNGFQTSSVMPTWSQINKLRMKYVKLCTTTGSNMVPMRDN